MNAPVIMSLSRELDGKSFRTRGGIQFKVLACEYFPRECIGRAHKNFLNALREGMLVSVSFRGHPVSVITVNGGVIRLTSIQVGDDVVSGATNISTKLDIMRTRTPEVLYKA